MTKAAIPKNNAFIHLAKKTSAGGSNQSLRRFHFQ
jgi:hypothetical protein